MKRFAWVLFLITACSRPSDFLYYYTGQTPPPLPPPPAANITVQVKDTIGDPYIDILWVIDNSGSMGDDQQNLIANADFFIREFVKNPWLEWRMGIISTDSTETPYLGFASPYDYTSASPVLEFQNAVGRLGTGGSGTEETFQPVQDKITQFPTFLRPNAKLALIIVTDEEEQSSIGTQQFVNFLQTQKGDLSKVLTFGIFGSSDLGCTSGEGQWYTGGKFEQFIKAVNGTVYPLCSPQFGQNLADMSAQLVKQVLQPKIMLKTRPKTETLKVLNRGVELKAGTKESGGLWMYDYDLNAILFHSLAWAAGDFEYVSVIYEEQP